MRRKAGQLVPLEIAICDAAARLRRRGVNEFHGYEIAKRIGEDVDSKLLTAYGTLYRALGRLESMGLLESRWEDPQIAADENRPGRRLYSMTGLARRDAGRCTARRPPQDAEARAPEAGAGMSAAAHRPSPPRSCARGRGSTRAARRFRPRRTAAGDRVGPVGAAARSCRRAPTSASRRRSSLRLLAGLADDLQWRLEHRGAMSPLRARAARGGDGGCHGPRRRHVGRTPPHNCSMSSRRRLLR